MENENSYRERGEKFIILAGAGSTADIGYPMLDSLEKLAMQGKDESFNLIRSTRLELDTKKTHNKAVFEELIGRLKLYKTFALLLKDDHVMRENFKTLESSTNEPIVLKLDRALVKCYRILAENYGPKVIKRKKKAFTALSDMLAGIARENQNILNIYTTNYDCSYQVMASDFHNISFFSHISNVPADQGAFKDNWFNARADLEGQWLPKIYIHRLHGCVAWFNMSDDGRGPISPREEFGAGGADDLNITDEELQNMCIKLIDDQLRGTNRAFASAFHEFGQQLKKINTLLIWGYSFRDAEVTKSINQALLDRADKPFKIYYIDPYMTPTTATETIQKTIEQSAPVQVSRSFVPEQITWIPREGIECLKNAVMIKIKEAYHAKG